MTTTNEPTPYALRYHGPGFIQEGDDYDLTVWLARPAVIGGIPGRDDYQGSFRRGWDGDDWARSDFEHLPTADALYEWLRSLPVPTDRLIEMIGNVEADR